MTIPFEILGQVSVDTKSPVLVLAEADPEAFLFSLLSEIVGPVRPFVCIVIMNWENPGEPVCGMLIPLMEGSINRA